MRLVRGILLAVAGLLFACNQRSHETVRIRVADARLIDSTPLYVAVERGFFRKHNIEVELLPFPDGKASMEALSTGKADVALSGDFPVAMAAAAVDKPAFAIVASLDGTDVSTAVVVRTDRGIAAGGDLRGRRIGVTLGTTAHYALEVVLLDNLIAPEEVTLVDIPTQRLKEAFEAGEVDAVAATDPNIMKIARGAPAAVIYPKDLYKLEWLIVASRQFLNAQPSAMQSFLKGLHEGSEFADLKRAEAASLASRYLEVDPPVLEEQQKQHHFGLRLQHTILLQLENQTRWGIRRGYIRKNELPAMTPLFDPMPMLGVSPEMVTVIQ